MAFAFAFAFAFGAGFVFFGAGVAFAFATGLVRACFFGFALAMRRACYRSATPQISRGYGVKLIATLPGQTSRQHEAARDE